MQGMLCVSTLPSISCITSAQLEGMCKLVQFSDRSTQTGHCCSELHLPGSVPSDGHASPYKMTQLCMLPVLLLVYAVILQHPGDALPCVYSNMVLHYGILTFDKAVDPTSTCESESGVISCQQA